MTQSAAVQPYIVCDNLVKVYKLAGLEVLALQGLELTIARGEMVAIVGPSGSGKSTLINILGGLDWPTAGKIMVGEVDLLGLSRRDLARYHREKIGSVWQQSARNLIPFLTAQQNVELPMLISGVANRASTARAVELLDAVGLADRARHLPGQLSGGQQQRVAIAVALANSPELILADEPTGEMDSALAQTIWAAFRELNQRYGLTVIIVTHDTRIAASADRVVKIRDGKISSETVRRVVGPAAGPDTAVPQPPTMRYDEYTVLDTAGRLQVPREYLDQFGMNRRVQLESCPEGILIRPDACGCPDVQPSVPRLAGRNQTASGSSGASGGKSGVTTLVEEDPPPPPRTQILRRWLSRWSGW